VNVPSDPSLTEVAEQLARTWSRRSAGERSAFIDTLSATTSTPATPPREDLSAVSERAALSGAVAPRDLVRGMDREEADHALDTLAPEFDRTLVSGRWTWTLRTGARQETLARLAAAGTVPAALEDVAGIATDAVGDTLRRLAAGQVQPSALFAGASPRGPAPATVTQALTWAVPLGGFAGDLAEARRRARLAELANDYNLLLRYGIFGRESELRTLQAFAEMPADPSKPVPLLPVIGIGGVGKSTLLASFILPLLDRLAAGDPTAPAVVVIDFDRVLFRVNAEVELSFEVTRQLGCAAPVASADFSVLRYQTAEQRRYTGTELSAGSVAYEVESRDTSDFESQAGLLVQMHGLQDRPVLLVLDTFEEWQRDRPYPASERAPWNDPEQRILEWITRLRSQMGLAGLRVVVSGRAEVATTPSVAAWDPLPLQDLDPPAALALLGAHDITGQAAESLAALAGTNPLTLRVAARFYQRLTPDDRQRFLAGEDGTTHVLDEELRRAVLYDRFLSHIEDGRVQRLAHPGLVLRRVTADLVRLLLAGPCGLGEIDATTATELIEKLADEIWLVRRTPDGLRHQPDVRRAMLRMMSEEPEYAGLARRIHQDAIDWYTGGKDRELSPEAAEVEAFYHRMMLEPDDQPVLGGQWEAAAEGDESGRRWTRLAQALGAAIAEFSPGVAAQVRVLRGDDLPDDEAHFLPVAAWNRWIEGRGATLVAEDQGAIALGLLAARLSRQAVAEEPAWLAQACSDTARWDDYWKMVPDLDRGTSRAVQDERRSGRYALLNALFSAQNRPNMVRYDRCLTGFLDRISVGTPLDVPAFERLFLALLCNLGVPASPRFEPSGNVLDQGQDLSRRLLLGADKGSELGPYPIDQPRRALVWAGTPEASGTFRLRRLAGLFRPNPAWITAFSQLIGDDSSPIEHYVRTLVDARGTASHDVLGEWAARFARPWGDQVLVRRDRLRDHPELISVFRGDNPEMRPAIRLALAEACSGRGGLRRLAGIAQQMLPIPVVDLNPGQVPLVGSSEARKTLVQLVEYVDRSGVMGEFLAAVRTEWPDHELLHRVGDAFGVWDGAHTRMLDKLAEGL
jgi:hypothetical protein